MYQVIVVDPPWDVKKLTHKARPKQIGIDYSTMSVSEIASLDIGSLADKQCWCFLWTTQKFLFESKDILNGWGFNHLTTMVWEKTYGRSSGMPLYGFRWNGEFILVGYKTKPELWPKRPLIPTVFAAPNIRHSQKPDLFYQMVGVLGESRIDVFDRHKRDGWDCIGYEIDGKEITEAIRSIKE